MLCFGFDNVVCVGIPQEMFPLLGSKTVGLMFVFEAFDVLQILGCHTKLMVGYDFGGGASEYS